MFDIFVVWIFLLLKSRLWLVNSDVTLYLDPLGVGSKRLELWNSVKNKCSINWRNRKSFTYRNVEDWLFFKWSLQILPTSIVYIFLCWGKWQWVLKRKMWYFYGKLRHLINWNVGYLTIDSKGLVIGNLRGKDHSQKNELHFVQQCEFRWVLVTYCLSLDS